MLSFLKLISFISLFFFLWFNAFAQTFTSSDLPLILINTNGQTIKDDPKVFVDMGIIWNGSGNRNALSDPNNNYNGKVGIELRGSSSQYFFPKKSYGFETKTSDLIDMDVSLLGLPEENDWILYAPYTDKTMIRNVLTYTLDASLGHWSPRCRYVELFLNGNYEGVYVLMEKIKRNQNRVDIAKLTTEDISGADLSGGYIIKIDKTTVGSGDGWYSNYLNNVGKTYYQYDYPDSKEITNEQKTYIQSWMRNMENTLFLETFAGNENYHAYLNDSSFIDFMIINELTKNVDAYRLSSYLYKGKKKRINCGPIWDFNLGYGNADYYNGWSASGFQYDANLYTDASQNPFWWKKLLRDPSYVTKLKRRWSWIRKHELSDQRISFVADSLVNLLAESQVRNYKRWPILATYVWPNYNWAGNNYAAEVNWMKNWITQRLAFLDYQWYYDFTGSADRFVSQSISIFPNPFNDRLTIQLSSEINGKGHAELFNSTGKQLRKEQIVIQNGQIQLDFSENNSLIPGLYILRIAQNNRVFLTEKVVKRP